MDFRDFKTVKNEYRPSAVWYLCGEPTPEETDAELARFAESGFGKIFLKPTQQLAAKYMGRDYFELIRTAARRSARYGIELWLYDDNAQSSGSGGGEIASVAEYRAAELCKMQASRVHKTEKIVCADKDECIVAAEKSGSADICSDEAADCFADQFYGALRSECHRFLGMELCGTVSEPRIDADLPYSAEIYAEFAENEERNAFSLFREDTDGRACRRKYLAKAAAAVKNGFIKKCAEKCRESGLRFSLCPGGRLLENQSVYLMSELPCTEFDCEKPNLTAVKRLTSCAEIFGKKAAVNIKAPRFGAAGARKSAAALCIMLGADEVRYDGIPFTFTDGQKYEKNRFAADPIGERALSEYVGRLLRIKAETEYKPEVCLVYPTEYLRGLSAHEYENAAAEIEGITRRLLHMGVSFHIADEDLIDVGSCTDDSVVINGVRYKSAILPNVPCFSQTELPDSFIAESEFCAEESGFSAAGNDALTVNRLDGGRRIAFSYFPHGGEVRLAYDGDVYLADASEGDVYLLPRETDGTVRLCADCAAAAVFVYGAEMLADDAPLAADGLLTGKIQKSQELEAVLCDKSETVLPLKDVNACFGKKAARNDNIDNLRARFYALPNGEAIKLKFPFDAELPNKGEIAAYIENGGSMDTVLLNGRELAPKNAGKGIWRADISGILANGKNTFALEYRKNSAYAPAGEVRRLVGSAAGFAPIYLVGEFETDGKSVLRSAPCGENKPLCCGCLEYTVGLPSEIGGALLVLEGSFDSAVVKIGKREKTFFSSAARIELFGLDAGAEAEIRICRTPYSLFSENGSEPQPFGITAAYIAQ